MASDLENPINADLAKALIELKKTVQSVAKDAKNEHGKYQYASIDDFYLMFREVSAEAGIFVDQTEVSCELVEGENSQGKATASLKFVYDFTFLHESGARHGPFRRTIYVSQATAQSCGAAQSYAKKYFLRGEFEIATGDDDDENTQKDGIVTRSAPTTRDTLKDEANRIAKAIDAAKDEGALDSVLAKNSLTLDQIMERSMTAHEAIMQRMESKRTQLRKAQEDYKALAEQAKPSKPSPVSPELVRNTK